MRPIPRTSFPTSISFASASLFTIAASVFGAHGFKVDSNAEWGAYEGKKDETGPFNMSIRTPADGSRRIAWHNTLRAEVHFTDFDTFYDWFYSGSDEKKLPYQVASYDTVLVRDGIRVGCQLVPWMTFQLLAADVEEFRRINNL